MKCKNLTKITTKISIVLLLVLTLFTFIKPNIQASANELGPSYYPPVVLEFPFENYGKDLNDILSFGILARDEIDTTTRVYTITTSNGFLFDYLSSPFEDNLFLGAYQNYVYTLTLKESYTMPEWLVLDNYKSYMNTAPNTAWVASYVPTFNDSYGGLKNIFINTLSNLKYGIENENGISLFSFLNVTVNHLHPDFSSQSLFAWFINTFDFGFYITDIDTYYDKMSDYNASLQLRLLYDVGYFDGYNDGVNGVGGDYADGYNKGFENGKIKGELDASLLLYEDAYNDGYNAGNTYGYSAGYQAGSRQSHKGFQGLMLVPASILGQLFRTAFNWLNFTVLGINLWSIIVLMASFSLLLLFIKMFLGR